MMKQNSILSALRRMMIGSLPCKGIEYLCHLAANANHEITYLRLYQAINSNGSYETKSRSIHHLPIKMTDMIAVNEVLRRLDKINDMLLTEHESEPIEKEKEQLKLYISEVYNGNKITNFTNNFTKITKSTKESLRLGMIKLKEEKPTLYEEVKSRLCKSANSVIFYA